MSGEVTHMAHTMTKFISTWRSGVGYGVLWVGGVGGWALV